MSNLKPVGVRWRSSQAFIIFTAILGLFSETFLFAFIVPILSYMVEVRLELPPDQTQWITTTLLASYGLIGIVCSPIIAHFADKTSNRRTPLILALIGCLIGTVLLAICSSLWMMFLGRLIQSISSSAGWLVSFATLTDNVSSEHIGKTLGTAMTFVSAGIILAPAVAGALLQLAGYWAAWSAPLLLLGLGLISRLFMLETRDQKVESSSGAPASRDEEAPLIQEPRNEHDQVESSSSPGFYRLILRDGKVLVGLSNILVYSLILSAFDTTLPLHAQRTFDWGPLLVGSIFLEIQIPGLLLGPIVGWIRDSIGLRWPTTIGWVLVSVFLGLLGLTGPELQITDAKGNGQVIFIIGIIGIGLAGPLIRGGGTFQLIAITKKLEVEKPMIFGAHGATSRMFSLTEVAMNIGITIGPVVSGSLVELVGFASMIGALAVIALAIGVSSFITFPHKPSRSEDA